MEADAASAGCFRASFRDEVESRLNSFCAAQNVVPPVRPFPFERVSADIAGEFVAALREFEELRPGVLRWARGHSEIGLFGHGVRSAVPRRATVALETVAVIAAVGHLRTLNCPVAQ